MSVGPSSRCSRAPRTWAALSSFSQSASSQITLCFFSAFTGPDMWPTLSENVRLDQSLTASENLRCHLGVVKRGGRSRLAPGEKGVGLSDEVARWLAAGLRDQGGRDKMTKTALAKSAEVSQDTIYRLLRGEGEADQETLTRLARALRIPEPSIERTLRVKGNVEQPATVLTLVRSAAADLRRAEQLLATSPATDARVAEEKVPYDVRRAHDALDDLKAASPRPSRARRRSGSE